MQDVDCKMCSAKLPALRVCRNSAHRNSAEGFHSCRVEALSDADHATDTNK